MHGGPRRLHRGQFRTRVAQETGYQLQQCQLLVRSDLFRGFLSFLPVLSHFVIVVVPVSFLLLFVVKLRNMPTVHFFFLNKNVCKYPVRTCHVDVDRTWDVIVFQIHTHITTHVRLHTHTLIQTHAYPHVVVTTTSTTQQQRQAARPLILVVSSVWNMVGYPPAVTVRIIPPDHSYKLALVICLLLNRCLTLPLIVLDVYLLCLHMKSGSAVLMKRYRSHR